MTASFRTSCIGEKVKSFLLSAITRIRYRKPIVYVHEASLLPILRPRPPKCKSNPDTVSDSSSQKSFNDVEEEWKNSWKCTVFFCRLNNHHLESERVPKYILLWIFNSFGTSSRTTFFLKMESQTILLMLLLFFLVDHNVYNDTLIQAWTGNPQFFYRSRFWEKIPFTDRPQNAHCSIVKS